MKINSNLTISFWLRGIKNPKIRSTKIIYCRVLIKNERLDFSTNQKVLEKNWCLITERIKDKLSETTQANDVLNTICNDIINYYSQNLMSRDKITIVNLKEHLSAIYKPTENNNNKEPEVEKGLKFLLQRYKEHIDQRFNNKLIAEKTSLTYKSTVNHLLAYLKKIKIKAEFDLKNLDREFFYEYEKYLLSEKRLIQNTAFKYLKQTRQLFDFAFENGWIKEKVVVRYNVKYTNPVREILNIEDIKSLQKLELIEKTNKETRDAFLFQCYTGFAYNELQRLSILHLKEIEGRQWLIINRQKTSKEIKVIVLPQALELIRKYDNHPSRIKSGKLFPIDNNAVYNVNLKKIQAMANIDVKITSHIARHTFSTTIALSNGMPLITLSKILGHSSVKITEIYAKVLDEKIASDFDDLYEALSIKQM
jgi:site-specific recombinase XerD